MKYHRRRRPSDPMWLIYTYLFLWVVTFLLTYRAIDHLVAFTTAR